MDKYRLIKIDRRGDVFCVGLRSSRLEEGEIQQLGDEILALCNQDGCRKLALSLGPEPPDCLYSVFLAKLISVRNALKRLSGQLVLCDVAPVAFSVFEACLLHREFVFAANFDAAVAHFAKPA
jgi:hypothetical protein